MDPRYPIGPFVMRTELSPLDTAGAIDSIADTPDNLQFAVQGLDDPQLDTPYRDGGWTVRQVVHHLSDSHLNAYIRVRTALTEDTPTIKVWDEARWAELEDARSMPVAPSLQLLESLHYRWVHLLRSLEEKSFSRSLIHPEMGSLRIDQILDLYAWHGRHHVAHITTLRAERNW